MIGFKKLVYTPAGSGDATLAIAACRAGGIGILNAEFGEDSNVIHDQLAFLSQKAKNNYGLKLSLVDEHIRDIVAGYAQKGLNWLILDGEIIPVCQEWMGLLRQKGVRVLAEVKTLYWPGIPLDGMVDGVVLKGNESGGFVGENSSFILVQKWLKQTKLPLYIRGGVTPCVAAACHALGLAGGVLDSQVLLLDESPVARDFRFLLENLSGNETIAVGNGKDDNFFRLLVRPGHHAAQAFAAQGKTPSIETLKNQIDWKNPGKGLLPVGQDICFAGSWRKKYGHLAAVFRAIDAAIDHSRNPIWEPLSENSSLAQSIGVSLPLVQGPMSRVSDNAEFAHAVSQGGALPVLAFALNKGDRLKELLENIVSSLGGRPWGIGLLGFAPQSLLDEQLAVAEKFHPRLAIIAGGRPDQAVKLEKSGIISFLHVPSAALIPLFLQEGARRFIFEGRECGGHIGPLSSFVLWSTMIDCLISELDNEKIPGKDIAVLFAGGIHDAVSSAMVQVMAAPLTAKGIKIGFVMGSAYLFTREIVSTGAITPAFQKEVIKCEQTVSLESGPGHASRCAYTPFAQSFFLKRQELLEKRLPAGEIRKVLDELILGRLRIAAKGCGRVGEEKALTIFDEESQVREGMYMAGQLAALRSGCSDISTLHREVIADAGALLSSAFTKAEIRPEASSGSPADIAIIGIAGFLPKADTISDFWTNILAGVDAITEVPPHRWDWRLYFDQDRQAKDKIYSKWGGFLDDLVFDPTRYGMPPKSIESVDSMQLMALEIARRTLVDAGYENKNFDREHTSVIIGASGGLGDVGMQYGLRAELPRFQGDLSDSVAKRLPEWTEDTFAGILPNVTAGRIANRLDLGGVNFTVDAACASSLAALYQGIGELTSGRSSLVIAGGVDTVQGPFGYLCFSKTQALSPRGRCQTFDASADGIVISEGIAMVALKRLEDAKRDNDRIYAVIKGIGGSSDGKAKGLAAPSPKGQMSALTRAYVQAGFSPDTVEMFEAHGTGTVAGDTAELESTTGILKKAGSKRHQAVVGSVKTLIGHTKATSGIAGLIKASLALHYRILPPHFGVTEPNPVIQQMDCPLYLIDKAMPWLAVQNQPRRAAVSAFGFGGTNFHAVLEEYTEEYRPWVRGSAMHPWPSELVLWSGIDQNELISKLSLTQHQAANLSDIQLIDIACSLDRVWQTGGKTLAIVATDTADLMAKIEAALGCLQEKKTTLPPGIYYQEHVEPDAKVAVLFPGQGSQYTDMFRELALNVPVFADTLAEADDLMKECFSARFAEGLRLSHFIYPRGAYSEQAKADAAKELASTDVAQPALGAIEAGLWRFMRAFGLKADMLGGHSYGEYVALFAADAIDFNVLMALSEARGRFIVDAVKEGGGELGMMAAVKASRADVEKAISDMEGLVLANHNSPQQSIISGSVSAIKKAVKKISNAGMVISEIPVAAAFHSAFVQPAQAALAKLIRKTAWRNGNIPVYSNTTGEPHHEDARQKKKTMIDQLVRPVEFVAEIEAMYRDGARIFIELGPKSVLTGLLGSILENRPYNAIPLDGNGRGITGMLHAFGQMLCLGVNLNVEALFEGRNCLIADPSNLSLLQRHEPLPKHAWMLNGSYARRAIDPVRQTGVRMEDLDFRSTPMPEIGGQFETGDQLYPEPQRGLTGIIQSQLKKHRKEEPQMRGRRQMAMGGDSPVMAGYFDTMRQFLETQERVMSMYLGGTPDARHHRPQLSGYVPQQRLYGNAELNRDPAQSQSKFSDNSTISSGNTEERPARTETPLMQGIQKKTAVLLETPENVSGENVPRSESVDPEKMTDILLTIVEERTGYPRDMLGLDQDLEADLGIDSIKRVEIVGALLKALPPIYGQKLGDKRAALNTQATLNGMLHLLSALKVEGDPSLPFDQAEMESTSCASARPFRHIIKTKQEPISHFSLNRIEKGHFLITRDTLGMAEKISEILAARNCTTSIVQRDLLIDENRLNAWCASSETGIETIDGILHLAQLGSGWLPADASVDEWQRQLQLNEKSLFSLLRNFSSKLKEDAAILSVSALGGLFGRDNNNFSGLTLQGGAVGLLKSLFKERPHLKVKAIDIDPSQPIDAIAISLMEELDLAGGRQEIGYPEGKRTIFLTVPAFLDEKDENTNIIPDIIPDIIDDLVVLATGGLKGITAELLRELAKPGNTLLLTGRTLFPEDDAEDLQSLATPSALRNYFVSQSREGHLQLTPAEIQHKIKNILAAREMRNNINDFRQCGAAVEYYAVDVTKEDEVCQLFNTIYDRYPNIGGVVHGAGVIEDKLLADKTGESWSRVVETKVMGLLLLQKYLRPESLRFFTVLSSVAGRYGNSGQTDYATANELMNRVCCQLNKNWRNKVNVKAICWGPWGPTKFGTGMVTKETETKFAEKGVMLVSADVGRRLFKQELTHSSRTDIEIIGGEGPWEEQEAEIAEIKSPFQPSADNILGPFLYQANSTASPKGNQTIAFSLGDHHAYLQEHCIDNIPVLPAAVALEIMAEAAGHLWPDWTIVEIRDFQLLKGIELKDQHLHLIVNLDPPVHAESGGLKVNAVIQSVQDVGTYRIHYRSILILEQQIPKGFKYKPQSHTEKKLTVSQAYSEFLFHGPRFQVIETIPGLSHSGATASLRTTSPAQWLINIEPGNNQWLFDPAIIDAAAQMSILWARSFLKETALPAKFGRVIRYCEILPLHIFMHFEQIPSEEPPFVGANVYFSDSDNNVLMLIENMECVSSADLNRLGGTCRIKA